MPDPTPLPTGREQAVADHRAGERFALLLCGLLGLYALYDSAVFYATPEQRLVYALVAGPLVLGGAAVSGVVALSRRNWMAVLLLAGMVALPLATGLQRPGLHLDHVLGDAATILLPLAFLMAMAAAPALRLDGLPIRLLLLALVLGACVAPVVGRNPSGRFEPPNPLLACALLSVGVHRRGMPRAAAAACYLLLAALVAGSGERTVLVAWLMLPFAALALRHGLIRTAIAGVTIAGVAALALGLAGEDARHRIAERLRIEDMVAGRFDSSLEERLEEARDIRSEMQEWSALQWAVGAGHGACWRLVDATPHEQNVQPDGTVHHVHITPVALAYRYGSLGALAVLLYVGLTLRPFLRLREAAAVGAEAEAATFFQLGAAAYLWTSLLSAALVDPLFSLVLAGRLLTGAPARSARPIS